MTISYEGLLDHVLLYGDRRTDRTGTGTLSVFAPPALRYSLKDRHVPLITSKRVPWKMATAEFLWMLSGSTNISDIESAAMRRVWANWADGTGYVGPTYGAQYRSAGATLDTEADWPGVDQLARVLDILEHSPDSRRAVISLWSAPELDEMALEPCMVLFQFSLRGKNYDQLELVIYQRSADLMLGVPFDLYQGGLFAHLVAHELTMRTGRPIVATQLIWQAGDAHIYTNHITAASTVLHQHIEAEPMAAFVDFPPTTRLLKDISPDSVEVYNYNPMPAVNAGPIAV